MSDLIQAATFFALPLSSRHSAAEVGGAASALLVAVVLLVSTARRSGRAEVGTRTEGERALARGCRWVRVL